MDQIVQIVMDFANQHAAIATILLVIGGLRAIFKPIMSVLHAYVDFTPNPADNAALEKIEASGVYKGIAYALDYLASIKLVK